MDSVLAVISMTIVGLGLGHWTVGGLVCSLSWEAVTHDNNPFFLLSFCLQFTFWKEGGALNQG